MAPRVPKIEKANRAKGPPDSKEEEMWGCKERHTGDKDNKGSLTYSLWPAW